MFDWEVYWARVGGDAAGAGAAGAFCAGVSGAQHQRAACGTAFGVMGVTCCRRACLLVHVDVATNWLGFVPSLPARMALDQIELGYLGFYFLLAAAIFLQSYGRTRAVCCGSN